MLPRTLEHELMDSDEDAHQYDAMDHAAVNDQFVTDLQKLVDADTPLRVLDLGVGTGHIPIEFARRAPHVHITAVDAARSMLDIARRNVAACGFEGRIDLVLADAKRLPFDDGSFDVVVSNSIVHHIAEPRGVIAESVRVVAPGGLLFHRDLARPNDEAELQRLVETYAADATPHQRKLFADSLHAALTLNETQQHVAHLGLDRNGVRMSSERHWTWCHRKLPGPK